jgi:hypothetical protein
VLQRITQIDCLLQGTMSNQSKKNVQICAEMLSLAKNLGKTLLSLKKEF